MAISKTKQLIREAFKRGYKRALLRESFGDIALRVAHTHGEPPPDLEEMKDVSAIVLEGQVTYKGNKRTIKDLIFPEHCWWGHGRISQLEFEMREPHPYRIKKSEVLEAGLDGTTISGCKLSNDPIAYIITRNAVVIINPGGKDNSWIDTHALYHEYEEMFGDDSITWD